MARKAKKAVKKSGAKKPPKKAAKKNMGPRGAPKKTTKRVRNLTSPPNTKMY
jgi:hypothetical protein